MRLGIDIRSAIHEPAGIGTLTLNLVKQLMRIDQKNEYYLYGDVPFNFGVCNSRFHAVTKSFGNSSVGKAIWHLYAMFEARYLRRLDRFISVGSLQMSVLTKNFTVLVIPDLSHVLLPEFHVAKSRITGRLLMKKALLNARKIVAISDHTKNDILTYMSSCLDDAKVSVAHIACDEVYTQTPAADDMDRVRRRYSLPQKYILSVGTLEPRKNYETLIKAFRECVREGDTHDLVIAGRKGWFYKTIFDEAKRLGVESRIQFLGFVPLSDMPALYSMADVFVYPSLYEGFGIPPLEAMVCGIPVITSNITSLPEVTGDAAILIDPRDAQELSAQLKRLLGDEKLRAYFSRAGVERARQFSWSLFAENVLAAAEA